jgi:hypothetical protein
MKKMEELEKRAELALYQDDLLTYHEGGHSLIDWSKTTMNIVLNHPDRIVFMTPTPEQLIRAKADQDKTGK